MMTEKFIKQELTKQAFYCLDILGIKKENLIGSFLYGSQNYGLETEESDVDSYLLYDGPLYNFPNSIITTEEDAHIKVMNIEAFIAFLRICDLNVLEILHTKYFVCFNEKYFEVFRRFCDKKYEYLDSCKNILLISFINEINKHIERIDSYKNQPLNIKYNLKDYNIKQVYCALRFSEMLERVNKGEDYFEALISNKPETLKAIKTTEIILTKEEVKEIISICKNLIKNIEKENYGFDYRKQNYILNNLKNDFERVKEGL